MPSVGQTASKRYILERVTIQDKPQSEIWRTMQRLMTTGAPEARNRTAGVRTVGLHALKFKAKALPAWGPQSSQVPRLHRRRTASSDPPPPVSYDNKYEVYGGINFMNFQAGQNLPKRMNFAGAETSLTYFLTPRLGVTGDYRFEGGTTPVFPSPGSSNPARQLVLLNAGMGGVTYRGPKGPLRCHRLPRPGRRRGMACSTGRPPTTLAFTPIAPSPLGPSVAASTITARRTSLSASRPT